jgi:uncharacterized protein (DUF1697 family)
MDKKIDSVILVTFGRHSKCLFMLASDYQSWRKTIDAKEYVLVTHTDMQPDDLAFLNKANDIISRLENEIKDVELTLEHRFKSRKPA